MAWALWVLGISDEWGDRLILDNMVAKRDGSGISPMDIRHVLGRRAERDYRREEIILMS